MKRKLWLILEKYDSDKNMRCFCNAISNVIKGTYDDSDKLDLVKFNNVCESDMDSINEAVNLKSILF